MIDSSTRIAGRYRVDARLGGGGMADVYDAHDEQLDRPVALKILRGIDEVGAARRFAEEIRLTARVNHPNIVGLYDAGEHDGSPYLVLERVTGGTLAGEMSGGLMEPRRVAAMGEQLASALSHAHAVGIVHRDVKPTNVLMTDDGSVRLADFGIAVTATATRLTVAGTIAGSAGYVSPEQVLGSGAGAPSDVYALGLVLLECLAGAPPWSGTTVEVALARISSDPTIPDDLPQGWAPLIAGMTARDPQDRPHIDLVGHALSRLAQDESYDTALVAPPPPPTDRRIPAVAGMSMLVLLLSALMVLTTDVTPDAAIASAAAPVNVPAANALLEPAVGLSSAPAVPDWVVAEPRTAQPQAQPDRRTTASNQRTPAHRTATSQRRPRAAAGTATTAQPEREAAPATDAATTPRAPRRTPTATAAAPAPARTTRTSSGTGSKDTRDTQPAPTRDVATKDLTPTRSTADSPDVSRPRVTTNVSNDKLEDRRARKRRAKLRAAAAQLHTREDSLKTQILRQKLGEKR